MAGGVYQNRLVLVGGNAVPDLFLVSRSGVFDDFATATGDPAMTGDPKVPQESDGFWQHQVSARRNQFHSLVQQEGMLIFGSIGESNVPPGAFTPLPLSLIHI